MKIVWHIDDLKMSHVNEMVLDGELEWLDTIYGSLFGTNVSRNGYAL
jgi:hypothetical protein